MNPNLWERLTHSAGAAGCVFLAECAALGLAQLLVTACS